MNFKFQEDEQVVLGCEYADLLPAGSVGVVFCAYATDPPAYEVNFRTVNGSEYASIVEEADLRALSLSESAPQTATVAA